MTQDAGIPFKDKRIIRKMFDILRADFPGRRFVISADGEMVMETTKRRREYRPTDATFTED